jgi:hypothetical protein
MFARPAKAQDGGEQARPANWATAGAGLMIVV